MRLLLPLLGVSVMIGLAGPAHADPEVGAAPDPADTNFLFSLHAAGITYNRSDLVISTGKAVCRLMANGTPSTEILADLKQGNPEMTPGHGEQFVAISAQSYCPNQLVPSAAN
ncbi:MAG: DUF732 domain-containing protein [Mycobacterium sp.]